MTTPYSTTAANAANDERDSLPEFEAAVNVVIETLIDGVRGFETAADVASDELKSTLAEMGAQRRSTTEDLIRVSADEDMNPVTLDDSGTPTGVLHRTWLTVRETVQGDEGVVAAAVNGEQHAREEITRVLNGGLPESAAAVVRRALAEIETTIARLEGLLNS